MAKRTIIEETEQSVEFTDEQLDEIADLIEVALGSARKKFGNDHSTIDNIEQELFDAFNLWDDEGE
jgi:hypothetical protein